MIKCIFTTKATAQQYNDQYNRIERQRFQFSCDRERICAEKLRRTFFRSEEGGVGSPLPVPPSASFTRLAFFLRRFLRPIRLREPI